MKLEEEDKITREFLKIVEYFQPDAFLLENIRFGKLNDRPFMRNLPLMDVYYF